MSDKPNILLITSDQQHWDTIGAFHPIVKTPNLDRLTQEGTLFTRAYCPNPTCTPSRASIITGLYPSQHGAWSLGTKLPEDVPTVGNILLDNGYETALIGKAHFQPLKSTEEYPSLEAYPILQDWEFWKNYRKRFYGFKDIELARNHTNEAHVGQHYVLWLEKKGCLNWRDYYLEPTGNMKIADFPRLELLVKSPRGFLNAPRSWGSWDIPEDFHYNAWIAERSIAKMQEYKEGEKPFFLWASFFDPHPEYFVPKPWDTMYNPDDMPLPDFDPEEHLQNPEHFQKTQEEFPDYSAYVVDQELHGMHSHLQKPEELKKDIALYYGMISMMDKYIGKILDSLDALGLAENTLLVFTSDHGHFIGQHGLVRKGPFPYEDLIKVPFIARWPKKIPPGQKNTALQSLVDLSPTFLTAAGIRIPYAMTGKNQIDVWKNIKKSARTCIICEDAHEHPTLNLRTYVDERYKITVMHGQDCGLLFDLQADPEEKHNLWNDDSHAGLKQGLLLKYISAELDKERRPMPRIKQA